MADVFLCHSSADKEAVEHIATRLEKEGISVWLDSFNLIAGERFTPKIEAALTSCNTIAVFVGPMGRGPYQNEEFDYAVNVRGTQGARVIPVLLPGAVPEMITGLLTSRTRVQFAHSLDEIDPFRLLVGGIRAMPARDVVLKSEQAEPLATTAPPNKTETACPYRPLSVFDVADHRYFCGRDDLAAEAVARVEELLGDAIRCLSIVGASGSGKSSLARAGVLWSLQQEHPGWTTIVLEPGIRPHEALAERMLHLIKKQVDGPTLKSQGEEYLGDTSMLQRSIAGALGSDTSEGRAIVLVDQFEEVFTICESEKARDAFIANLLNAARDSSGKAVVLLCVRADFYENCAKTELAGVLSKQQVLVGPMTRDQLRSAIRDPAVRAGFDVEPELVTNLVRDCEEQPSPLPLLQIVLEKLWRNRDPQGRLTLAAYYKTSFEGALDDHAERFYQKLLDPEQRACRSVMLQLVEPLGDGRYTRRRVPAASLLPGIEEKKKDAGIARVKQVETVLGVLSGQQARLVAVRIEGGTPNVELAHESILRGWKRLSSWLDQDNEFLIWKRRLRFDVADWRNPKTAGGYIAGHVLDRARAWLKERPEDHSGEERGFIEASTRRRLLRRTGVGALAAAIGAGAVFGGLALRQSRYGLELDQAAEQLTQSPGIALLLAYDASKHDKSQRAREVLHRAVQQGRPPLLEADNIADIAMNADGTVLAAAAGNSVLVWSAAPDAQDRTVWSPLRITEPKELAFEAQPTKVTAGPDGKWIAAGDAMGTVRVWRDAQPQAQPVRAGAEVLALAFAADGHLAVATKNKQIVWWDAAAGAGEQRVSTADEAWALAISPDSPTVAAGTIDGFVRFWKPPATGWRVGLHHDEQVVNFVAYSKDGKSIGSATRLGKAYRWDASDPSKVTRMRVGEEIIDSAAMDGEARHMAAHTTKGSVILFDTATGSPELYLSDQAKDIAKVAIDAAGTVIAAGGPKGIRIYELRDEALTARARIAFRDSGVTKQDCSRFTRVLPQSACESDLNELK